MTRTDLRVWFEIPDYWTPEQALAVYELLDGLRERILCGASSAAVARQHEDGLCMAPSAACESVPGRTASRALPRCRLACRRARGRQDRAFGGPETSRS
jgi:hypothetical protein